MTNLIWDHIEDRKKIALFVSFGLRPSPRVERLTWRRFDDLPPKIKKLVEEFYGTA